MTRFYNSHTFISSWIVGTLILGVFLYTSWISVYRIDNFLTFSPWDSAMTNQALWQTLHGRWFEQTFIPNAPQHGQFALVLLLPLYVISPNATTIFLLKNALVILSVIPVFLVARRWLHGATERLVVCTAYLLSPFLISFCHCETHLQLFAMSLVAACYYFYIVKNFRAFMGCAILAMLTKESFPFLYLAWGVHAMIDRRDRRWCWWLTISSAVCFLLYLLMDRYLLSATSHSKLNLFENYYGAWGGSMGSCLAGMISHPLKVVAYLTEPDKWFYLFYVAFPFLPFIFLRPRFLILAAPNIAIIFLMSGRDDDIYHPVQIPCFMEVCLFSFLAFLDFLHALETMKAPVRRLGVMGCVSVGLLLPAQSGGFFGQRAILCLTTALLLLIVTFRVTTFRKNILSIESGLLTHQLGISPQVKIRNTVARRLLAPIPEDGWLAIPAKYSMAASSRSKVILYNGNFPITSLHIYSESEPGYVFLDLQDLEDYQNRGMPLKQMDSESNKDKSHAVNLLEDRKHWDIIFKDESLFLLKRRRS